MILDRGPSFGAYYLVDPADPHRLFGARWENSWPCGTFTQNGILLGVTFFFLLKGLSEQGDDPVHSESFDVDLSTADDLSTMALFQSLLFSDTPYLEGLKPVPRYLVEMDLAAGLTGPEIIDTRAGVLVPEFLGFTLSDVLRDFPEIWQPTMVDGVEVPNIWKCSEEKAI